MSDLIWKLRQWFRKSVPFLVVGALSFGGYSLYKNGFFRQGVGAQLSSMAHKIPFFGSKFGHSSASTAKNYSSSRSSVAVHRSGIRHHKSRQHRGKRHHAKGRHHRRHR